MRKQYRRDFTRCVLFDAELEFGLDTRWTVVWDGMRGVCKYAYMRSTECGWCLMSVVELSLVPCPHLRVQLTEPTMFVQAVYNLTISVASSSHSLSRELILPRQSPRMPIHLLDHIRDRHLAGIKLHLLPVLCIPHPSSAAAFSQPPHCPTPPSRALTEHNLHPPTNLTVPR